MSPIEIMMRKALKINRVPTEGPIERKRVLLQEEAK
jgi:hypothetical protein